MEQPVKLWTVTSNSKQAALKTQYNQMTILWISVSVRGGLTLDEGIYIAQIVARTGDCVFEITVLCIACGFSFVKLNILGFRDYPLGFVAQWIMS